jgi:hypothetical protein
MRFDAERRIRIVHVLHEIGEERERRERERKSEEMAKLKPWAGCEPHPVLHADAEARVAAPITREQRVS